LRRPGQESPELLTLYLKEIGRIKRTSPYETIELAKRIEQGDQDARRQLIEANLRLVVAVARQYLYLDRFPIEDLIQYGNIGLIKAVERFDWRMGYQFSTYATLWIKQSIGRALHDEGYVIRRPVHIGEALARIRRASSRLTIELGRDPTIEELALETGLDRTRVEKLLAFSFEYVSLDVPVGEDDNSALVDFIPSASDVEDKVLGEDEVLNVKEQVEKLLSHLSQRQAEVIRLRFGLTGKPPMILEAVGKELGVTRECIRQIEFRALAKLRKAVMREGLFDTWVRQTEIVTAGPQHQQQDSSGSSTRVRPWLSFTIHPKQTDPGGLAHSSHQSSTKDMPEAEIQEQKPKAPERVLVPVKNLSLPQKIWLWARYQVDGYRWQNKKMAEVTFAAKILGVDLSTCKEWEDTDEYWAAVDYFTTPAQEKISGEMK